MIKNKSPKEVYSILNSDEEIVLIDVRTPNEYNAGHINGAINIDVNSVDFINKINELDKNKKYIVYCRSGVRSKHACEIMEKMGFKEVYNMDGGILSWEGEKLPIDR